MDDANVPSLLALPFYGYVSADDKRYQRTRSDLGHPGRLLIRRWRPEGGMVTVKHVSLTVFSGADTTRAPHLSPLPRRRGAERAQPMANNRVRENG